MISCVFFSESVRNAAFALLAAGVLYASHALAPVPASAGLARLFGCSSGPGGIMSAEQLQECDDAIVMSLAGEHPSYLKNDLRSRFAHYWKSGQIPQAIADYDHFRRTFPDELDIVCRMAGLLGEDFGTAVSTIAYESVIAEKPSEPCGYLGLILDSISELRFQDAIAAAHRAVKATGPHPWRYQFFYDDQLTSFLLSKFGRTPQTESLYLAIVAPFDAPAATTVSR